jgi:hypothetical protein
MLQTMTTADWLRRAADAWDEADAIQDREARHTKVALAEEYERLAKHAAYLAHYETYARGMTGEDQVNILIERNRNLLGQAEGARQKTQQLKVEHHLIALRALEARPLAHSNRSYRRIARGEQDPLVLVRRTPRARRRYTSSQARKEANLASELGQRASELKLST